MQQKYGPRNHTKRHEEKSTDKGRVWFVPFRVISWTIFFPCPNLLWFDLEKANLKSMMNAARSSVALSYLEICLKHVGVCRACADHYMEDARLNRETHLSGL